MVNSELGSETARQPTRLDQVVVCLSHLRVNARGNNLLTRHSATKSTKVIFVPFVLLVAELDETFVQRWKYRRP